jgi:hypothetical protein
VIGCEGGPGFLRGARLRPIPDSWFPLSEQHYAIGNFNGIRLKVTGYRQHLSLVFNLFIENAATTEVRLCEECAVLDSPNQGENTRLTLAWGEEPNHVGEYTYDDGSFIIPPASVRLIQGIAGFFNGPMPQKTRLVVALKSVHEEVRTFSLNFEVPGN